MQFRIFVITGPENQEQARTMIRWQVAVVECGAQHR